MADLTGFFRAPSANVNVTFTDSNPAATARIMDLGKITYEFEITPDQTAVNRIAAVYNAVDITIYQYDQFGNDLFDRLSANASTTITITVNFYNGETGRFKFSCTPADVTLDELTKLVVIKARPFVPVPKMGEMFASANGYIQSGDTFTFRTETSGGAARTYTAMSAGRFIRRVLESIDTGFGSVNVISSPTTNVNFTNTIFEDWTAGTGGFNTFNRKMSFVVCNVNSTTGDHPTVTLPNAAVVAPESVPAFDVVKAMAVLEGSVMGVGWDVFYRNRLNVAANTTLSYQDLLDLKFENGYNALQYIEVRNLAIDGQNANSNVCNLVNTNALVELSDQAIKYATFNIAGYEPFLNKGIVRNSSGFLGVNIVGYPGSAIVESDPLNVNIEIDMVQSGASSYEKSLPAGGIRVAGRIRGTTKVKPFQTIIFDNTTPARYQNSAFRSTYLSYDFKSDEVEFKAYQVT